MCSQTSLRHRRRRHPPQAIWDAITTPEWTERYGYSCPVEYELRPGGAYRSHADAGMKAAGAPDVVVDGEVIEADPPRRLVQTWRTLMDPRMAGGGWSWVLSGLKTALETGDRMEVTR